MSLVTYLECAHCVSTLREPYRLEGKKTMAYEVVEQFGGRVPHAMVYPTGGGTRLSGMWKASPPVDINIRKYLRQ